MIPPTMVAFGAGVNSAAMLIGMHARGQRPDAITFADTGGERPSTYAFVGLMSSWCESVGFPDIVTVKNDGMYESLEDNCLKKEMLPSLAYGFKSCSDKYKKRPQEKWAKSWPPAVDCWAAGGRVVKLLGIDIGETRRAKIRDDKHYVYRYPLIEWDWDRNDCLQAIKGAGLPNPGKSACFFCPASTKSEILALASDHPDLFARAVKMEQNASLDTVKGLGRSFAWGDYVAADKAQGKLFPEVIDQDCLCFDGEGDE